MKDTYRDALASNLISTIIIFLLLGWFDLNGNHVRNTLWVITSFIIITAYDFWKIKKKRR